MRRIVARCDAAARPSAIGLAAGNAAVGRAVIKTPKRLRQIELETKRKGLLCCEYSS